MEKRLSKNLAILSQIPILKKFYLAGGTGCALWLNHRISVDLDFFTPKSFHPQNLMNKLIQFGRFKLEQKSEDTLIGEFNNTRVHFLGYPYPLLERPKKLMKIKVAGLTDIGCMKLDAIATRGRKRDFVDLYFICQKHCPLEKLLLAFTKKYRATGYNLSHILKSLTYFADAEKDPMPKMSVRTNWHTIKNFFLSETPKVFKNFLK
ncbi:MAG: nucleotidyl transferase AbiEii/AbiGii toxin family protein [Candidatus Freyarchaeota archaeon]|nr:nucleotidyl transferase AbiEii/AbiGii toxin family protein [Candidatus Jordarchaeia archaeon]